MTAHLAILQRLPRAREDPELAEGIEPSSCAPRRHGRWSHREIQVSRRPLAGSAPLVQGWPRDAAAQRGAAAPRAASTSGSAPSCWARATCCAAPTGRTSRRLSLTNDWSCSSRFALAVLDERFVRQSGALPRARRGRLLARALSRARASSRSTWRSSIRPESMCGCTCCSGISPAAGAGCGATASSCRCV